MRAIERIQATRDAENYDLLATPKGDKIHFVGTGLPPSALLLGGRAGGDYDEDDDHALCGVVTAFEEPEEIPQDYGDDLSLFCRSCVKQATAKGLDLQEPFEDLPL